MAKSNCIAFQSRKVPEMTVFDLGPVRTNAFSFENAYISMRLGLRSTPLRWGFWSKRIDLKTLLKVDQNEYAYMYY